MINQNLIRKKRYVSQINIKLTREEREFIDETGYSPTIIFKEALKELGFGGVKHG